ncbi:hypothetical protein EYF80_013219 [Liparis tanakae]|uniref:Uncharacterized protein n=1 Tax=Liparis tanakae TaxID=230148 RepID=A0A4Z2IEM6_9TELE|nr:hypothetical protein EYF80_013219 [Liparis tanakae]
MSDMTNPRWISQADCARTVDLFGLRWSSHTLRQEVMKEERSSFEERTAAVAVTDTVLARCYAS